VADTDVAPALAALGSGDTDQILAALGDVVNMFTGASDPFLNGEGQNFNPLTWGFTQTQLMADGQVVRADIKFLREASASGTVLNHQGVPIGARVRLTGLGPLGNGAPGTIIRAEMNSDPATGVFSFTNAALEGPWQLQAASPFYPVVLTTNG